MMSFVYPSLLWALGAICIPIIVHLFNFQRPKKVFFTNVRLLKIVSEQSAKGVIVKKWWLLLIRILAIFFIVLAFAQPVFKFDSQTQNTHQNLAVYIDNSLSMQALSEGNEALQVAKSHASKIVSSYPKNTEILFTNNDFESADQYFKNSTEFQDRLTEISFSNINRNAKQVYERSINAFESEGVYGKKDLYWFSDFQKNFFNNQDAINLDSMTNLYLVPIQSTVQGNVWIDSVWLQNPFIQANIPTVLSAQIKSKNNQKKLKVNIKLKIDNVLVSSKSISFDKNESEIVDFEFTVASEGFKKAVLEIDDNPVVFDNQYYFTIQASKPIDIVTIGKEKNNNAAQLISDKKFFRTEKYTFASADFENIKNAELVIVDGFDMLNQYQLEKITSLLNSGLSVVFFPSENPKNDPIKSNLLNIGLKVSEENTFEKEELKVPDISNPFFSHVFEKVLGNESMPSVKPKFGLAANGEKLLFQKNGTPILSKYTKGKGKIYLYNISQVEENQGIAKHAMFVPLIYKAAFEAAMSDKSLAYSIDHKIISLKMPHFNSQNPIKLKNELLEIIPTQYYSNGYLNLEIPGIQVKPGYYEVVSGKEVVDVLALNYSKNESSPEYLNAEQLKSMFKNSPNVKIFENSEGSGNVSSLIDHKWGYALWKWCLLLALSMLFLELWFLKSNRI